MTLEVEDEWNKADTYCDENSEPKLVVLEDDLSETAGQGRAIKVVIGHDVERGEETKRYRVPNEKVPGPVTREEASCYVVKDYHCKIRACALCPKVLFASISKYVISICELGYAIYEQRLYDAHSRPCKKFSCRKQLILLCVFIYLRQEEIEDTTFLLIIHVNIDVPHGSCTACKVSCEYVEC